MANNNNNMGEWGQLEWNVRPDTDKENPNYEFKTFWLFIEENFHNPQDVFIDYISTMETGMKSFKGQAQHQVVMEYDVKYEGQPRCEKVINGAICLKLGIIQYKLGFVRKYFVEPFVLRQLLDKYKEIAIDLTMMDDTDGLMVMAGVSMSPKEVMAGPKGRCTTRRQEGFRVLMNSIQHNVNEFEKDYTTYQDLVMKARVCDLVPMSSMKAQIYFDRIDNCFDKFYKAIETKTHKEIRNWKIEEARKAKMKAKKAKKGKGKKKRRR
tara:strand:- start:615 stop:1412 length:798 start_codon:yes stop_codon:yes gene_type:complete